MSSVPCTRSEGLLMLMSSATEAITSVLGKQGEMLFFLVFQGAKLAFMGSCGLWLATPWENSAPRYKLAVRTCSPEGSPNPVWSKISNALRRLGFRSRNFLAQLVSETSRACTMRVRRSSLRRLWNDLGSHACLHHRNRRPGTTTEERISG